MRTNIFAGALLLLLLSPIAITQLRPTRPEELAYLTVKAMERRDSRALYDLGSPSERERAGITVQGVASYLEKTLYREGGPGPLQIVKVNDFRPNCVQFLIQTGRVTVGGKPRNIILTIQQKEGEPFRVALGELLWNIIPASYPRTDPLHSARVYKQLSKETGIHGWYTVVAGWSPLHK
jgi:hypothetical protein